MRKKSKMFISLLLTASMLASPFSEMFGCLQEVHAADSVSLGKGSYATKVTGNYYWDTGSATNESLLSNLPYEGRSNRHTTENYTGPLDTSDWGTSFLWDFTQNSGAQMETQYSQSVYAIPLAFKASSEGMYLTNPSTCMPDSNIQFLGMYMPNDGSLTDFVVKPSFATSDAKVDKVTDWTYDVVMQNSSNAGEYMKTTMVQGSPFAYFQLVNSNTVNIGRKRNLPASVVQNEGGVLVVRVYDNADEVLGYENYDYYAIYAPGATNFNVASDGEMISNIAVNLPSGSSYFSFAILCSTRGQDDEKARSIAAEYKPYAYNFVTDTRADYEYNEKTSTLTTTYKYSFDKKAESTADGTIMGILPHHYKNMSDNDFLGNSYRTVRGTMKVKKGSSFTTSMKYSGFIPNMPSVAEGDEGQLQAYVNEYVEKYKNDWFAITNGGDDTYWRGKALNRTQNVLAAAETIGDTENADKLYGALKADLEDWFTADGTDEDHYFYYDSGLGTLFGFPQSFSSVDQINDHHFHYGYFIYAAAQIALRDPEWASDENYGLMIKELIKDIACNERDGNRYPYLRNFAPYEGHSWASGHSAFADGNNHESSSEALNAWAGIIMFGEAIGDKEIRDLGIYLYTTEISAVNNYWFDVDGNVLDDRYRYGVRTLDGLDKNTAKVMNNQASMVWGGKYVYGTWWTAEPLQVQGINLLPMNPSSFYLAGNEEYIRKNLELALYHENNFNGPEKLPDPTDRWNDIWSEYQALADPDYALTYWDSGADEESGESRAHTYHYIKSLQNYGTPNTSITSDTTLSTVFEKNGVKTYFVYNAGDSEKLVTFSDGTQVMAQPNRIITNHEDETQKGATYNITYHMNGGVNPESNPTSYQYGENIKLSDPYCGDYTFRGWYTTYDFSGPKVTEITPTTEGDLELWAKITKDSESEDSGNTETTHNGKGCELKNGELRMYVTDEADASNIIAHYKICDSESEARALTLSNLDGKEMTRNGNEWEVNIGPADTTKYLAYCFNIVGKTVTEIQVAEIGSLTSSGNSDNDDRDDRDDRDEGKTLAEYMVIHYKQNASGEYEKEESTLLAAVADEMVTAEPKAYTGYTFNSSKSTISGTVTQNGKLELKLYYDMRLEETNRHNITYYLNGGQNSPDNLNVYEEGVGIRLFEPEREGYTFLGWYTTPDFAQTTDITEIPATATSDYELYAKWEIQRNSEVVVQHTITYHWYDGLTTYETFNEGAKSSLEQNPTRPGYTFLGWYTTEDFTEGTKISEISANTTADVVVYAKWQKNQVMDDQTTENQNNKTPSQTTQNQNNKTPSAETKQITATVKVTPKKVTGLKLSKKKSASVKIKWKKATGASGYEVAMKTGKKGKYKKVADVKSESKVTYTKKKLKKGKTYYVKVRAYKIIDGKKVYGAYSSAKKCKF